jgi:hypothetical protein
MRSPIVYAARGMRLRIAKKLRIGVDIRPFYEPLTGVGWYLYYLLHELAKDDDVELYLFGDARDRRRSAAARGNRRTRSSARSICADSRLRGCRAR